MELENLLTNIISEKIDEKKRKNRDPQHCTKLELKKELNAMVERVLENMVKNGTLHEGLLGQGVYYEFN